MASNSSDKETTSDDQDTGEDPHEVFRRAGNKLRQSLSNLETAFTTFAGVYDGNLYRCCHAKHRDTASVAAVQAKQHGRGNTPEGISARMDSDIQVLGRRMADCRDMARRVRHTLNEQALSLSLRRDLARDRRLEAFDQQQVDARVGNLLSHIAILRTKAKREAAGVHGEER